MYSFERLNSKGIAFFDFFVGVASDFTIAKTEVQVDSFWKIFWVQKLKLVGGCWTFIKQFHFKEIEEVLLLLHNLTVENWIMLFQKVFEVHFISGNHRVLILDNFPNFDALLRRSLNPFKNVQPDSLLVCARASYNALILGFHIADIDCPVCYFNVASICIVQSEDSYLTCVCVLHRCKECKLVLQVCCEWDVLILFCSFRCIDARYVNVWFQQVLDSIRFLDLNFGKCVLKHRYNCSHF